MKWDPGAVAILNQAWATAPDRWLFPLVPAGTCVVVERVDPEPDPVKMAGRSWRLRAWVRLENGDVVETFTDVLAPVAETRTNAP